MAQYITNYQRVKIKGSLNSNAEKMHNNLSEVKEYNIILDLSEFEAIPNQTETYLNRVDISAPGLNSYGYIGALTAKVYAREYNGGSFGGWVYLGSMEEFSDGSETTGFIESIGGSIRDSIPMTSDYDDVKDLYNPYHPIIENTHTIPGAMLTFNKSNGYKWKSGDEISIRVSLDTSLMEKKIYTTLYAGDSYSSHGGDFVLNVALEIETVTP